MEANRGETGLIEALRRATHHLHAEAERSGVIGRMLGREASAREFAILQRNLLPAYRSMESKLRALPADHALAVLRDERLYRSAAIVADLQAICGNDWVNLPETQAARDYARRIEGLDVDHDLRLAAHCYTRYLGDLSGGRILRRLLSERPGLPATALTFYAFDVGTRADVFRAAYIEALDSIAAGPDAVDAIADEAVAAFRLNIALSEQVAALGSQSDGLRPPLSGTR